MPVASSFCFSIPLSTHFTVVRVRRPAASPPKDGRIDMNKVRRMILTGLMVGLAALLAVAGLGSVTAAQETTAAEQLQAVRSAAVWLARTHQNSDGGYTSFSAGAGEAPSSVGGTVDAILALSSVGYSARLPFPGKGAAPLDYLRSVPQEAADFAGADGGQAGKLLLALTAAAANPRDLGGVDVVAALTAQLTADGAYGVADVYKQATAVLGLASAGEPVPAAALDWITDRQTANGSWDDGFGTPDNPDATAMAIMALVAGGRPADDPAVDAARDFLAAAQLPDATWEYGPGFGGNVNSTALVVQALSAVGEPWHEASGPWAAGGRTPLAALLAFQGASGAFQADFGQGPFDDFFATVQALPGAAGRPFPLPARYEATQRGLACLESLQDKATGGWEQFAGYGVNAAGTARAVAAIRAAGGDPQDARWVTPGGSALDHLAAATPGYLAGSRGGRAGVVAQAVVAAGPPYDPAAFAGLDLPQQIRNALAGGQYDDTAFGIAAHAEAMLGLLAADEPVDPAAVTFLLSAQQDGDWGDADQNGLALNVLGQLGLRPPAMALPFLRQSQLADGGWGFGGQFSPSSTSEVVQGLVQVGQAAFGPGWSEVVDGRLTNAADAVLAQQGANGCWPNAFGPGDDPFATTDALVMLSLKSPWDVTWLYLPVAAGASPTAR